MINKAKMNSANRDGKGQANGGTHASFKRHVNARTVADVLVTYTILILVTIIFLFPIVWLVMASFSKSGSIYDIEGFFASSLSLDSYKRLFTDTTMYDYPNWLKNTLFVATTSSIIGTVLVILTAYTISRFEFKSRKTLMKGTLILSMFPGFMTMTAVYLIMVNFNMINNLWSLVMISAAGAPMGYLVQKGYFDTISGTIYEAARIDGAGNWRIFRTITLPLAKPIIVYTALTQFAWPWSDFILPKMLLKNKNLWTVAVGLTSLDETEFTRFAAGSVFIAVPIVILYFCLSRFLVMGVSAGAVKE